MSDPTALGASLSAAFDGTELNWLREDPFEAIPLLEPELTVELADADGRGDCSVEGLYHEDAQSITVHRALSPRRTKFTALHEYGHHRARRDPAVARVLARAGETAGRILEERIADSFASQILIPAGSVEEVLAGRQPTAADAAALFRHHAVAGSREACCVRIAQHMSSPGYVLLGEGSSIRFCATVGGSYRVRRGTDQGSDHLIARAARSGTARSDYVRLTHASGAETPEFSGHAVREGNYVFAVLTSATNLPWGGWVPRRESQARLPGPPEIDCHGCNQLSEAWKRCDDDASHRVCSNCGWCLCRAPRPIAKERACDTCFATKAAHLFPDDGSTCIDHF